MIFSAVVAYPYENTERATVALRAELHQMVAAAHAGEPDWTTLVVTGPVTFSDREGNTWFRYQGTVEGQTPAAQADQS